MAVAVWVASWSTSDPGRARLRWRSGEDVSDRGGGRGGGGLLAGGLLAGARVAGVDLVEIAHARIGATGRRRATRAGWCVASIDLVEVAHACGGAAVVCGHARSAIIARSYFIKLIISQSTVPDGMIQ